VLARPDEPPFLWSHIKIKEHQKTEILAMRDPGVRKHKRVDFMISKSGWYDGVGYIRRDVTTFAARKRGKYLRKVMLPRP
jgi:hypothetical protein